MARRRGGEEGEGKAGGSGDTEVFKGIGAQAQQAYIGGIIRKSERRVIQIINVWNLNSQYIFHRANRQIKNHTLCKRCIKT